MTAPTQVPYNTGKVKIGLAYERRQVSLPSDDEAHIQRALLGLHDDTETQRLKAFWGVVFFIFLLLLVVVYAPR